MPVMEERTTYIGSDVHKKMFSVVLLRPGTREPLAWEVSQVPGAIRQFTWKLERTTSGPAVATRRA